MKYVWWAVYLCVMNTKKRRTKKRPRRNKWCIANKAWSKANRCTKRLYFGNEIERAKGRAIVWLRTSRYWIFSIWSYNAKGHKYKHECKQTSWGEKKHKPYYGWNMFLRPFSCVHRYIRVRWQISVCRCWIEQMCKTERYVQRAPDVKYMFAGASVLMGSNIQWINYS